MSNKKNCSTEEAIHTVSIDTMRRYMSSDDNDYTYEEADRNTAEAESMLILMNIDKYREDLTSLYEVYGNESTAINSEPFMEAIECLFMASAFLEEAFGIKDHGFTDI